MRAPKTLSDRLPLPRNLLLRLFAAFGFGVRFWIVYFGCDLLAQGFAYRFSVHTPLDDLLPFLPQFGFAYLLINPLLALPVFALRETAALLALCLTLAAEVAVAGIVFLVFPVEPPVAPAGHGSFWLGLADAVNLTYNSFPSLHVALAVSVGMAMHRESRGPAKALLWSLVLLVCTSTVLTRQHFLLDAVAGAALAVLAMRFLHPALRRRIAGKLAADACGRTPPCPAEPPGFGSCSSDLHPGR